MHFKDAVLIALANRVNVAQFVSFSPLMGRRHTCIRGFALNHDFPSVTDALCALFESSSAASVNVRSFLPDSPKSKEFVYGISSVDDALSHLNRLSRQGLYTIVNETIDVNDGGVSGVMIGNLIEFLPGATPRQVEKEVPASLPRMVGRRMLETVYGFAPELDFAAEERVEFSIHPQPRGYRQRNTIVWELENIGPSFAEPRLQWPNPFSEFIGDKAYGLLVAHLFGLPVPRSTVIGRHVAPFSFGKTTGSSEVWLRTCPATQQPGKYSTVRGWTDPFSLLAREDPSGTAITAVMAQQQVNARYSGALAALPGAHGGYAPIIEGVVGFGDNFMIGEAAPTNLPSTQIQRVRRLFRGAVEKLGPVRFEWAADDRRTWILQLHRGASASTGHIIFPGQPSGWLSFHVGEGLDVLRRLIDEASNTSKGIQISGRVGITSHVGDLLRKARIPAVLIDW